MLCAEDMQQQLASCQVDYLGQSARLADLEATLKNSLDQSPSPTKHVHFQQQAQQPQQPQQQQQYPQNQQQFYSSLQQPNQEKESIMVGDAPPPLPSDDLLNSEPVIIKNSAYIATSKSNSLRGGASMQMMLKVIKSPPFIALLVFVIMLALLGITKVGVCGVQPEGDLDAKRTPNWKAILAISGTCASIVLIVPYVIRWRKNATRAPPSTSPPVLA